MSESVQTGWRRVFMQPAGSVDRCGYVTHVDRYAIKQMRRIYRAHRTTLDWAMRHGHVNKHTARTHARFAALAVLAIDWRSETDTAMSESVQTAPQVALDDYRRYREFGGRHDWATWWHRYSGDYEDVLPTVCNCTQDGHPYCGRPECDIDWCHACGDEYTEPCPRHEGVDVP